MSFEEAQKLQYKPQLLQLHLLKSVGRLAKNNTARPPSSKMKSRQVPNRFSSLGIFVFGDGAVGEELVCAGLLDFEGDFGDFGDGGDPSNGSSNCLKFQTLW